MTDDNLRRMIDSAINNGSKSANTSAAQQLFDFYFEHVKAGFTEEQAMAILLTVLRVSLGQNHDK